MVYKKIGVLTLLLLLTHVVNAQSYSTLAGARSHGLAHASSCLEDEWALFNNVAGLAAGKNLSANASCHVQPQLEGANRVAAAVSIPSKFGVTGFGIMKIGDNLYNEEIISGGFSNKFGLASLGIKVNYIQYNAEGFGRKGVTSVSLGGIASITDKLKIGAHIININQPLISTLEDERLPTLFITGIGLTLSEQVFMAVELEKELERKTTWKTGIEYKPVKKFSARTGFKLYPNALFFGIGFTTKKINTHYAYEYSIASGVSHQVSIGYQLAKK